MATFSGRFARVTVNADTSEKVVAELGSFTFNFTSDEVDTSSFGTGWGSSNVGMRKWSATCSGSADPTDTTGQKVLEDAYLSGSVLSDIRFYTKYSETALETINYYAPDTATDSDAGCRVLSYDVKQDKSGVATINFNLAGVGPAKRFDSTVSE